jgi:sugar transferase (PEP-CTERM/EpsH1 system associated)
MPKRIRIMHVVDSLGKGGLENGLVNLIQRLNTDEFEHVVYAIRRLGENAERLSGRARLLCLGKKQTDGPVQIGAVARAIREVRPDIVHSRNWGAVEAVLAARWAGSCSVIHSEHGLDEETMTREPWRRVCFRRAAFELADRVLSVSCQLRDLHARRTGFRADRITVIHNGVDSKRFCPDPAARARIRAELGMPEGEFCIGCVGNLFPVKDHITLLRAAAGIVEVCQDWRVLVIGYGPEFSRLNGFVSAQPRLKERVFFLGLSNRISELLNAMDVYVLPSAMEGISNSLLEAMATGLPVLATDTGGNPEVVADGESGRLFRVGGFRELAQELLLLRSSMELRLRLGKEALRRVREDFSLDAMVRKYDEVYKSQAPAAALRVEARAAVSL